LRLTPVLLVVRYIDMRNPLEYLGLVDRWRRGVLVGMLVSVMNFIGSWARFGPPDPAMSSVTWNSILSTSCAIGFVEEVPFRGFVLQKLEELAPPVLANAISSLLFTAIHLPGWLLLGTFRIEDALTIFAIGVALGAVFKFSGSLWSAVIAHSSNNLFLAIFFT
jgi:uncharacterized protein